MAGRNIQVNLQFNANVQNAKAQLQSLQTQLNNLINSNAAGTSLGITPQIQEATRSAMDLKIALNNATNINTGKLNLNKFQSELNRMGKDIGYFSQQMKVLGPEGVKAFTQVASAVAQADTKLFSLQGGMKKLANTFMNTVRWQLTSQAIMAVTSAVSETVSYAKELDTSLNNIRIVTGKSADQMATFAKQANNAAKALSTSTTKYTDASLIYYQQGLNDKAVKERTDVTVKLANVVGENAETVSEWMTAIWNNFDNGSESLEYYADVLAKLGAATASSADEIAGGLEKFAAVADTIGLSYEYAASALATITAETRQSEDVVGTALKTILSRMEQLKLGNNLDDGTSLGQYSLALQKVGVDIMDANKELKDMDIILQQTGARWETLARDEQIALAQSVAGIRQYTQFMALMDNWDVMEKNLDLTEQANGALQEQQRIYEESTKAAEERMKVASEAIKVTLLGGDDLTDLYNFGAGALEVINELLDAFGGLPTILLAVAAALTKVYQPQVASFLSQAALAGKDLAMNIRHPIKALKGENVSTSQKFRLETAQAARNAMMSTEETSTGASASTKLLNAEFDAQSAIIKNENQISASVKQKMEWQIEYLQKKKEEVILLDEIKQKSQEAYSKALGTADSLGIDSQDQANLTAVGLHAGKIKGNMSLMGAKLQQASKVNINALDTDSKTQLATGLEGNLNAIMDAASKLDIKLDDIAGNSFETIKNAIETLKTDGVIDIEELLKKFQELQSALNGSQGKMGILDQTVETKISDVKSGILSEETDKMLGGKVTDATKMSDSLSTIDENKFNQTNSMSFNDKDMQKKYGGKSSKDIVKSFKDQAKALKEEKKLLKDQQKGLDKSSDKYKALDKKIKANKKATSDLGKEMTKFKKNLKGATSINEEYGEAIDNTAKSSEDVAEKTEIVDDGVKDVKQGFEDVEESANKGGAGFKHWSDNLASGISNMATYAMGLSMLSSAFEQMGSSIAKGEGGWTNWISNISSLLMGIMMIMPALSNMNKLILQSANASKAKTLAEYAEIAATKIKSMFHKKTMGEEKEEQKEKQKTSVWKIISAWAGVAEDAGEGPVGWVKAIASAAMIAPIALAVGAAVFSFSSGNKQAKKEEKQEEVSKGTEILEAINENQELAESVTDLTEEYNALRNAGESTAEVLENMREKIPELIDSYKELAKTMGTHIDTTGLEEAYKIFEETGDISLYQKEQEKIDKDIKGKEKSTAETTANTAKDLAITAAREGDGRLKNDGTFVVRMGDADDNVDALMAEELEDYWVDNNRIEFDTTNNAQVIDAYNKMIAARDRLKEEGKQDNDVYRELNREIKAMSESMPDLINAQQQSFDLAKEEALLKEEQFNKDLGLKQVSSVEAYAAARADLIEKLKEEKDWTEAQAEAYLKASKAYGAYEQATSFFGKDGLSGFDKTASEQTIKEVKEWFANLPEEERTLAMTIDYTTVGNVQEAKKALEEAREKMRIADATKEATDLGADADAFEAYATILQATNKHLKNNKASAYEVAAANVRVNKGLEDLNKTWDDSIKKIRNNTRGTYEYAEGIGEISAALETMFGVKPSINFVETHLNDIERMLNGDKQAFEELQDSMSEDYVKNMLIEPEIVFDGNEDAVLQEADTIKNALQGALDELGDIEVGDNVVLSEKYTKVLQDALDAGQITQKQLEEAFKIKGYDLNFKTKTVPGPTTHYIRTYDLGIFGKQTVEYDEKTEMTVPLLNDADATVNGEGGSGSTVTATRNADGSSLSANITEGNANKKKDQLDELKNEKDRYHEINEIISDTERNLDKLAKAKDRAFGKNKVAAIKDEIKAQKELIKNNKQLLKEAKDYLKIDQKELIKSTASNLTIQFDEYGRIANYEALQNSYIKRLKAAAGNETQYEKINEEYEQFKEAAERYEETLNKVEEQQEKVNDEFDRLSELHVEEIETKVEIKVEMADDDKAYIDFLMQKTEDDAFAAAERIGNYGGYAKAALTKIDAAQEGIDDTQRKLEAGEITPAQAVELMRGYRQELIDGNAELLEIRNNVQDELTDIFEAFHEEIENGIEKLEHYGAVLNGYKNIIDIVGKGMLGLSDETMNTLNKAIVSNANDTIRAVKAQKDANDKTIAEMKQAREEAEKRRDEASVKEWDKQIEAAEAKGRELTTNLQDALASGLEAAATAFGDTVDQIIDNFAKQVSGIYDSIEEMREAWDRSLEVADRYLQTYEQTYELNKLNRNIQKSIDSTDNVKSQRELRGLQKEMYEMAKDGQQLSKYDLEYLQKKYDLLVAEQAFKDAQNAKSVVRLQRDSEGNYGYVYTADQDAINNAEQAYEDKLYAYQKWSADMDKELTELYISVNEKYVENMAWVKENFTEGTAEYQEHMDRVNREYQEDMAFITGENEKLINRNLAINQQFSAGVAETYKDTFLGQIQPNYNSFAELFAGTTDACEQATIQLNAAVIGLRGTFDEQFRLAGEDFDDFAKKADDKFGEIQEDSSNTADEIKDLADKMEIEMGNAIDAVEDFQKDYSAQMKKVRDQTDNTIKKVEALIEKYNKLIKKNNEANNLKTPTEVKGSGSPTRNVGYTPIDNPNVVSNKEMNKFKVGVQVQDQRGERTGIVKSIDTKTQKITVEGADGRTFTTSANDLSVMEYLSLGNASFTHKNAAYITVYDENGDEITKQSIVKDNLPLVRESAVDGYRFTKDGVHLYHLARPFSTGYHLTYWLNQTDLHQLLNQDGQTAFYKRYNFKSLDTGGYTGEWGPEGRLAMLHQKEIVLNAHDTENLLTAVSMIREISSQLETNALAMQYIGSLGKVYSAIHTGGDTLQQEVHITAEFPNATDHNEIEEAFRNLTNLASQYANRKS